MEKYISVFALNKYIHAKIKQDVSLSNIYIKGEISNYRPHPSGHLYFTLKDEHSRINAIMFASNAHFLDFELENGMQVLIQGHVSVYEVTGQYQLNVKKMEQDGLGKLYLQFEILKKSLEKEGLFDQSHKKLIPAFPKSIAILSAKQGAGLRDVVSLIQSRFPFSKVVIFPIPVQGKNAYFQIVQTLESVDKLGFDTIIIARGGGSIEELWNFNEELLARAIYKAQTPIISAIGHETDFTICDFVSDIRARTPTDAAVIATPDQSELKIHLHLISKSLIDHYQRYLKLQEQKLIRLKHSYFLTNPENIYVNEIIRLTSLKDRLIHQGHLFDIKQAEKLKKYQTQLVSYMNNQLTYKNHQVQKYIIQLDALSPLKVMRRGYTFIESHQNLVRSAKEVKQGDMIDITFYDGKHKAEIK